MSLHVVYAVSETDPPLDGPHVASTRGFYDFGTFVEGRGGEFPEVAHLVENGWSDDFAALEAELPRVSSAAAAQPDVAGVADELATAVKGRPARAVAVLVTDGEPGDGEDDGDG